VPDRLLWRRLTSTDFDAINGAAAPSGTGGGAMHIALGTNSADLPIKSFLGGSTSSTVSISTQPSPPQIPKSTLTFDGNPSRRGGEWRIADQFTHRHPAWSPTVGFPTSYNASNRPIVFVRNDNGSYAASFATENLLRITAPTLAEIIDGSRRNSGIVTYDPAWDAATANAQPENLAEYAELAASPAAETLTAFDPKDNKDGREKTLREVVRRQGQAGFRKRLLKAYSQSCAISGCDVAVILEAAHITPYRGPKTNHPSNGLLLRADLHTLFDLGLISADPSTKKVVVSKSLKGTEYWAFNGSKLKNPIGDENTPSDAALTEHRKTFS